jgi:DNA polymerase-3 subunit alpha
VFIPLKNTTHYSLLRGLSRPDRLAKAAKEYGYNTLGLTDFGVSGAIEFSAACKDEGIKGILGTKIRVNDPIGNGILTLYAKNKNGWKNLIKMVSRSYDQDMLVDDIPHITLAELVNFSEDLILLTGGANSFTANIFCLPEFCLTSSRSEAEKHIDDSKRLDSIRLLNKLKSNFKHIYLETDQYKTNNCEYLDLLSEITTDLAQKTGLRTVPVVDTHYINSYEKPDQELLICSALKATIQEVHIGQPEIYSFFKTNRFHLPKPEDFIEFESDIFDEINSLCDKYTISSAPKLPQFSCPNGLSELEYLRELARQGYADKNNGWDKTVYGDRAKLELAVIEKANLAGYFLIVADYVNWAKSQGWMVGCGRGSAAGCLIAYLVGITDVNPIPFNLLFERFYNEGRNSGDNIEYPDIDIDFPAANRDEVITYLRTKYGHDKVAQIVTFGRLQGRGALKEVFRVHEACDNETVNEITKNLPQESEISDKLEESKEDSIIKWVLENEPQDLQEYCQMVDGQLTGDYATLFEQAIRLEGTLRNQGKHASGVVIAPEPLADICPMISDKSGNNKICGYDMGGLKKSGLIKMDLLSTSILDKLMLAKNLLR